MSIWNSGIDNSGGKIWFLNTRRYTMEYFSIEGAPKEVVEQIETRKAVICGDSMGNIQSISDGVYGRYYYDIPVGGTILPSGIYNYYQSSEYNAYRNCLSLQEFRSDAYIRLPDTEDLLSKDISNFLNSKDLYTKLNTIYKIGFLLYGPPGEGKTAYIRNIINSVIPPDAIVINIANGKIPNSDFLHALNKNTEGRLKVFIFEELLQIISMASSMESFLTFLDGESSVGNSMVFATTNYPELLPASLASRPSRFDKLIKIDSPSKEARKLILDYFLMREPTEQEIAETSKMSTSAIKEACLVSHIKKLDFSDAIKTIKAQIKVAEANFMAPVNKIGF